jgi:hypothetical protein
MSSIFRLPVLRSWAVSLFTYMPRTTSHFFPAKSLNKMSIKNSLNERWRIHTNTYHSFAWFHREPRFTKMLVWRLWYKLKLHGDLNERKTLQRAQFEPGTYLPCICNDQDFFLLLDNLDIFEKDLTEDGMSYEGGSKFYSSLPQELRPQLVARIHFPICPIVS